MIKDHDLDEHWHSLALTLIDCGYLSLDVLEKEAVKRRWKGPMIAEVANALDVERSSIRVRPIGGYPRGRSYRASSGLLSSKRELRHRDAALSFCHFACRKRQSSVVRATIVRSLGRPHRRVHANFTIPIVYDRHHVSSISHCFVNDLADKIGSKIAFSFSFQAISIGNNGRADVAVAARE